MKLEDLKTIIDNTLKCNPNAKDCEVIIPISGEDGLGSTPSVGIKNAGKGFDWDRHMFMLFPETPLYKKR